MDRIKAEIIDLEALKNENIVPRYIQNIKIIASGDIKNAVTIQGLNLSSNAKKAILDSGGKILE